MFVDDNPASATLLEDHGPAAIHVRGSVLLINEIGAESEGGPGEGAMGVNTKIGNFDVDAFVDVKEGFLGAGFVFGPIVVFHGSEIKKSEIGIAGIVGRNFREVKGFPRGDDFGDKILELCVSGIFCGLSGEWC